MATAGFLRRGAEDRPNVTVVGDDDQAIYRWRGAAAGNLIAFRNLYPGAREVVLNDNHRSTQVILDAAGRLISYNNPYRLEAMAGIDKRLRSVRGRAGAGGPGGAERPPAPVRHLHFDTVSAEADGVAAPSPSASSAASGRGTWPSSSAATTTPTRSCAP
jgi:DNA helicase-2/ATP-dependent DNA helicase PcrA